jgi:single-stranded-DNA-specific exonuclease
LASTSSRSRHELEVRATPATAGDLASGFQRRRSDIKMVPLVWDHLRCDQPGVVALASALGVSPVLARLLCLRGQSDPEDAKRFLEPSLDHLHHPLLLTDMKVAVERLMSALAKRERIAIHGDFDADGITATVVLRRSIELLGGEVVHFIPERTREGYGLQPATVERLHADGAKVIVSVDCGIRAPEAAARARELGVDLIITDHHEPDSELPRALAVINPKRPDCGYPDKNLAGVGVALKLAQALAERSGREKWLPAFVKMAAIGTLADVVPLVGENRVIAKLGLDMLSRGPHKVGLRALIECAGLAGRPIDSYHIAFMIAPRINAAGRMSTPDIAARLLLATDEAMADEVHALAALLDQENVRRQQEERAVVTEARRIVETDPDIGARTVLVVCGEGWHRGVIGIVASKLVDRFHRPAIVLALDGPLAYGSCRSIPAFDMLAALERCAGHFHKFGGHRHAAGLTMDASRVKSLREAVNACADEVLEPGDLCPRLRIDGPLPIHAIRPSLAEEISRLAPFGAANPRPVFHSSGVSIADGPRVLKEAHLKMALRQNDRVLRAVAWRAADREEFLRSHRDALDVAFSLELNTFNGQTTVELSLADARPAQRDEGIDATRPRG